MPDGEFTSGYKRMHIAQLEEEIVRLRKRNDEILKGLADLAPLVDHLRNTVERMSTIIATKVIERARKDREELQAGTIKVVSKSG